MPCRCHAQVCGASPAAFSGTYGSVTRTSRGFCIQDGKPINVPHWVAGLNDLSRARAPLRSILIGSLYGRRLRVLGLIRCNFLPGSAILRAMTAALADAPRSATGPIAVGWQRLSPFSYLHGRQPAPRLASASIDTRGATGVAGSRGSGARRKGSVVPPSSGTTTKTNRLQQLRSSDCRLVRNQVTSGLLVDHSIQLFSQVSLFPASMLLSLR